METQMSHPPNGTRQSFEQRKSSIQYDLQHNINDLSPIGQPDEAIVPLLRTINTHPSYITTSSCSGRLSLFQYNNQLRTKGGKWLVCAHTYADSQSVWNTLIDATQRLKFDDHHDEKTGISVKVHEYENEEEDNNDAGHDERKEGNAEHWGGCVNEKHDVSGVIVLKFEPLILHVACNTLYDAQRFLRIALQCGCRESGIGMSRVCYPNNNKHQSSHSHDDHSKTKNNDVRVNDVSASTERYTVYIRCSIRLEVPMVTSEGELLVNERYVKYLMQHVDQRFDKNFQRIERLHEMIKQQLFDRSGKPILLNDTRSTRTDAHTPQRQPQHQHPVAEDTAARQPSDFLPSPVSSMSSDNGNDNDMKESKIPAICCARSVISSVQQACKVKDYNDTKRRITQVNGDQLPHAVQHTLTSTDWMIVPLTQHAWKVITKHDTIEDRLKCLQLNHIADAKEVIFDMMPASLVPLKQSAKHRSEITPSPSTSAPLPTNKVERLHTAVQRFLKLHKLPLSLLNNIPKRWEQLNDLVLLPSTSFNSDEWHITLQSLTTEQHHSLWRSVADALRAKRVAQQREISTHNIKREAQVQLLLGEDSVVIHKENGILYKFDACKIMFSSGNLTAKIHLTQQCVQHGTDEILVDLYAGIGYFILPLLKYASNVKYLHAAEINPLSVQYLKENMNLNKIDSSRYTIHEGDNRTSTTLAALYNTVDRVLLGLLPSSEDTWLLSLKLLKESGGFLHIHANVTLDRIEQYKANMIERLMEICQRLDDSKHWWIPNVYHTEVVKDFAPRVVHVIYDVEMRTKHVNQSTPPTTSIAPAPMLSSPSHSQLHTIHKFSSPTDEDFWHTIFPLQQPAILCEVNIGNCVSKWSPEYLESLDLQDIVSVHVCPEKTLQFQPQRNYVYKTMTFQEMMKRINGTNETKDRYFTSSNERYYMRAIGDNPRKETANFFTSFPSLKDGFHLPAFMDRVEPFSTVLRISSRDTQLWTHYDIVDNLLIQISGSKRVLLFPPTECNNLYLSDSSDTSSSPIVDIDSPDTLKKYPRFRDALRNSITITLHAGEILFIPACWFHNVTSLDTTSIAINVFWKSLSSEEYELKDLYGNRDLLKGKKAIDDARRLSELIDSLPTNGYYRGFYHQRVLNALQSLQ